MSPARTLERINYISSVYNELTSRRIDSPPTPFRQDRQVTAESERAVRVQELVRTTNQVLPTAFRREQQAVVKPRRAVQSELVRNTCSKASEMDELVRRVHVLTVPPVQLAQNLEGRTERRRVR